MYFCNLKLVNFVAMEDNEKNIIQEVTNEEYKWGFTTDIDTETIRKGLDEEVVRLISKKKNEPEQMIIAFPA